MWRPYNPVWVLHTVYNVAVVIYTFDAAKTVHGGMDYIFLVTSLLCELNEERCASVPRVLKYIKIEAMLPKEIVRDVAVRCHWKMVVLDSSDLLREHRNEESLSQFQMVRTDTVVQSIANKPLLNGICDEVHIQEMVLRLCFYIYTLFFGQDSVS